jgi:hypothetical protein
MAYEAALWKRVKAAGTHLKQCGFGVHLKRIENSVGSGHPDVEGCIDGVQIWIELKSEERPKRLTTPIRFKVRPSQDIWLQERVRAGCRHCFALLQVGQDRASKLYLVPGHLYPNITTPEPELERLSILRSPTLSLPEILLRAAEGFEL